MHFEIHGTTSADSSQFVVKTENASQSTIALALKVNQTTGNVFRWLLGKMGGGTEWERVHVREEGKPPKVLYITTESAQRAFGTAIALDSSGLNIPRKGIGDALTALVGVVKEHPKTQGKIPRKTSSPTAEGKEMQNITSKGNFKFPSALRLEKFGLKCQKEDPSSPNHSLEQLVRENLTAEISIPHDITHDESVFLGAFMKEVQQHVQKAASSINTILSGLSSSEKLYETRVKSSYLTQLDPLLTLIQKNPVPSKYKITVLNQIVTSLEERKKTIQDKILHLKTENSALEEKFNTSPHDPNLQKERKKLLDDIGNELDLFAFLSTIHDLIREDIEKIEKK